ncbi:dihydropteroate synthase [Aestuariimicrobium ganziense]|uniref:dihydropteroate synthase n=1 Tax=Aestuariimicrobium ganziense TaxID=2773677 RepID=UPI0019457249|nr:dihydropteroate synthase [Aestuariimicrobium ganziense]
MTDRTLVMAVLNVTPDSFSDGGRWLDAERAVDHGLDLVAQGADIIDVGGESTRPGAHRPSLDEELNRVVPVVAALSGQGVTVSVDTMRAAVAEASIAAGAAIINDVSGGLADPDMLATVAGADVDYIAMHWRGHGEVMNANARYLDVVAEVLDELVDRRDAALAAGVAPERLVLDPGYGFAKDAEHNWALLRAQEQFLDLGHRLLVGVSRKRFLGELLADEHGPRPADERDDATVALTTHSALQGVWAVRTHTARAHRDAVEVVARLRRTP